MQGFDPNGSLQIDQSIMQESEINMHTPREGPLHSFTDHDDIHKIERSSSLVSPNEHLGSVAEEADHMN